MHDLKHNEETEICCQGWSKGKTPGKNSNIMELGRLPEAKFRATIITMVNEIRKISISKIQFIRDRENI